MIVTDKFVFVHMHKCGGTFINVFLKEFFPQAREIGYHFPVHCLPPQYRHLPVLGTVRNPWDFYVSYYEFQKKIMSRSSAIGAAGRAAMLARGKDPDNGLDAIFEFMTEGGRLGFSQSLQRLLQLGVSDSLLDSLLPSMPREFARRGPPGVPVQEEGFRGMNLLAQELSAIAGTGWGFCTFLFHRMYGEGPVHILKLERLREGLLEFLDNLDLLNADMERHLQGAERENTSEHAQYCQYYDEALQQQVCRQDAWLIERYGFEFEPSAQALHSA